MKASTKLFFTTFQKGYQEKDVSFIDEYIDALFEDDVYINVIGTGNSEVFSSKEAVKELIEGDWLYWGDLTLKMETLIEKEICEHSLFLIQGDLQYRFKEDDETDSRYLEFIKEIIEEAELNDISHIKYQHMKAHYVLDHFLHKRQSGERYNDYPITMVFVCKKIKGRLKIMALTFTNPPNGEYPDERIHPYTGYDKDFIQAQTELEKVGKRIKLPSIFNLDKSKDFCFIDVNGYIYQEKQALDQYQNRITYYDKILINQNMGLIYESNDLLAVTFIGHVIKNTDHDQARLNLHHRIRDILASNRSPKDQMFIIRREMSVLNKEIVLGDKHDWPFRVFVILRKVKNDYVIEFIQFGYPMDMILEDKHK